jgi:hypothetical protein
MAGAGSGIDSGDDAERPTPGLPNARALAMLPALTLARGATLRREEP